MKNVDTEKYVNIMIESLEKKKGLYEELLEKTVKQNDCIINKDYDSANWAQFKVLIIEKDSIIDKVTELDTGFDKLFERVKPEFDANKEEYTTEIKTLQKFITELTDIGVKISATEERNRVEIEKIMTAAKTGIGNARRNMKVTSGYITSMYGNAVVPETSTIDSKK